MKKYLLFFLIFLGSFIYNTIPIIRNTVLFGTDEMYWISSAKIVPLLLEGTYKDPFWREYYGFVNFNGAKYIYGIGLNLLGHHDFSPAGVAPQTYYQWVSYDGKPFPQTHPFYPVLRDARLITAFFASLATATMFLFVSNIFPAVFPGLLASVMFLLYPETSQIATHAFADSFFLFFEILFLTLLPTLSIDENKPLDKKYLFRLSTAGIVIACIVATKINGAMFLLVTLVWLGLTENSFRQFLLQSIIISCSALIFFLLLHPNFFFPGASTLIQMVQERIAITQYHISYFSIHDPSHVILSPLARLRSFALNMFPIALIPFFTLGVLISIWKFFKMKKEELFQSHYLWMIACGCITFIIVLSYTVFDEGRYYLPILPFVILVSVSPLSILLNKKT